MPLYTWHKDNSAGQVPIQPWCIIYQIVLAEGAKLCYVVVGILATPKVTSFNF